jgi:ABC-type uncharacterized transport system auxiliary subunit
VKRTKIHLIAAAILVLLLAGCGSVPQTYYYIPTYEMPASANHHAPLGVVIGVEKFQAEVVYQDDRLIYRDSPFEVKYYSYRRWIAEPRHLVTEKAMAHLRHSGAFQNVVSYPSIVKLDYVLRGRVLAFEEWDANEAWHGKVALSFELLDPAKDEIVWRATFEKMTPAEKKLPVAVVQAVSTSLSLCLDEMVAALKSHLRTN